MISPSLKGASFTACFTLLSLPCQAIVDLDGDGMSDVWESHYGFSTVAGQASLPEQAPGADPDGDGYSNLRESQMVTDPNSALTGSGTLRPTIERQAGYQNLFTLTWPTRAEQWYYVVASTDLAPESWFYVTAEFGDGNPVSLGIEALDQFEVPPDKLFWKIEVYNGDWDGDGLDNFEEQILGSDLSWHDSDEDGMPDRWEYVYGLSPVDQTDGAGDDDEDGLANISEYKLKLLPLLDDTDGDGILDGDEDSDKDGLSNLIEVTVHQTDPRNPDSDLDGLPDGWEISWGFNPKSELNAGDGSGDADEEGLSNFNEYLNGTNPHDEDTDYDGTDDLAEVLSGGNPNSNADQGQPPPPEVMVDVPFTVSDPSGSHSEKWKLTITGLGPDDTFPRSLTSPAFGQPASSTLKLRKWNRYEITIEHAGSDPSYLNANEGKADFDWESTVDGKPTSLSEPAGSTGGVNNYFTVGQNHWLVENREAVFTTEKHGDDEDLASGKKAFLIPVKVKDNVIATGVDDLSVTVKPSAPGYRDKFWIMAPAGGPAYSNHSLFEIPVNTPTPLKLACPNATPNPETITLEPNLPLVAWSGAGSDPSDNAPTFKAGEAEEEISLQIGVKSMKKRTVRVAIHPIASAIPQRPLNSPNLMPTQAEIKEKLDQIFGYQINAYFDVAVLPERALNFDTADASMLPPGTTFVPPEAPLEAGNGSLDTFPPNHGGVETDTIMPFRNPVYDINVFVLGGASPIFSCSLSGAILTTQGAAVGFTKLEEATCFVDGDRTAAGPQASIAGVLQTIAHEVGHVMIGEGHPDQGSGAAPLPGTNHGLRLLASGTVGENGKLIVKAEWDAAETWLKNRPNGDN